MHMTVFDFDSLHINNGTCVLVKKIPQNAVTCQLFFI